MSKTPFSLDSEAAAAKAASAHTRDANEAMAAALPFADRRSFENAQRGFIASIDPMTIERTGSSRPVYSLAEVGFLEGRGPTLDQSTSCHVRAVQAFLEKPDIVRELLAELELIRKVRGHQY